MKTFKGGFHVPDNKSLSADSIIEQMPAVTDYYVSLSQHIGKPAELVVNVGDTVKEGQLLAKASGFVSANIHSPVCGEIADVSKRKNAQGSLVDYVHIKANGKQETQLMQKLDDPTPQQIIERVAEAGIVGMGGAGFPTAVKIQPQDPVDTLIINAAECEPYLNCDNRLMIERSEEFIKGVRLIAKAINVSRIYIGLEANKMEAYAALTALDGVTDEKLPANDGDIVVVLLKKKYPQGAEKTLIKACVNRDVPVGGLPSKVGCIVCNVASAYAVYDAVFNGTPLYKRLMTVSGRGVRTPKNIEVRIGTPLTAIADFCGGLTDDTVKLVSGGPMMGFSLASLDVATTKTDSGFLALTDKEASTVLPTPCINCGRCASVCPMRLMPMYIDFYATVGDYDKAVKIGGAMNCFECGTCAYVCPAKRPIVQSVRLTKNKMKEKK
ncbi:MAG: electron transport complex subunit RsxC [Corallococcus sp.]|nr:electron transport complex subunit RsxC [Corallococcus sp.]